MNLTQAIKESKADILLHSQGQVFSYDVLLETSDEDSSEWCLDATCIEALDSDGNRTGNKYLIPTSEVTVDPNGEFLYRFANGDLYFEHNAGGDRYQSPEDLIEAMADAHKAEMQAAIDRL